MDLYFLFCLRSVVKIRKFRIVHIQYFVTYLNFISWIDTLIKKQQKTLFIMPVKT